VLAPLHDEHSDGRGVRLLSARAEQLRHQHRNAAEGSLYNAIVDQRLTLLDDPELARHASNATAKHSRRGWRISKPDDRTHIDGVIALAMAVERAEVKPEPVELLGWLRSPASTAVGSPKVALPDLPGHPEPDEPVLEGRVAPPQRRRDRQGRRLRRVRVDAAPPRHITTSRGLTGVRTRPRTSSRLRELPLPA
jgi:hypothetical protein